MADNELKYSKPGKSNNAVLGRLSGPCADIINPTRNGRKYSQKLWEKVFNNDIVKEHFEAGGIFGELGHPADRSETDMEKIAICMKNPPKRNNKGLLVGEWDILDTPNGRIAKTLADYGYKLGISSRGNGDVSEDLNGDEVVDEDTYDFQGFDLVLLPAVKSARLSVMESLNNKKSIRKALMEELNKVNDKEKEIMENTLANIGLNDLLNEEKVETEEDKEKARVMNIVNRYREKAGIELIQDINDPALAEIIEISKELNPDYSPEKDNNIKESDEETLSTEKEEEADNNGSEHLTEALKDSLNREREKDQTIQKLQEQISVSYTKELKLKEELDRFKSATIKLSDQIKELKALRQKLISESETTSKTNEVKAKSLEESLNKQKQINDESKKEFSKLSENLKLKETTIENMKENFSKLENEYQNEISSLKNEFNSLQEEFSSKKNDYNIKISKANKLIEKYKTIASSTVNKYIESKAITLGITSNEIKNRLGESYTLEDIDNVCDDLQNYQLNISKLPFGLTSNKKVKMRVTESKNEILKPKDNGLDDDIDDTLLKLANL